MPEEVKKPRCMTRKDTYTFDYPEILKFEKLQMTNYWMPEEPAVSKDLHSILTDMSEEEKHGIITVLRLFTIYELQASNYWLGRFRRMFPRPDFMRMATVFGMTETNIHAPFYDEINKLLGLSNDDFYSSYVKDETLKSRMDFIDDIVSKRGDIYDDLLSIAVFSMIEGAVLYSSFAYLKSFQANGKNKLGAIVSGIEFSSRDEHCLSKDTQVLTKKGYKNITNVSVGDEVVQYNTINDTFSYVHPTKIIKTVSNESYLFKGDTYCQRVTKNHRMIIESGEVLAGDATGEELYVTLKQCDLPKPEDFVNSLLSCEYDESYLNEVLNTASPTWASEVLSIYKSM